MSDKQPARRGPRGLGTVYQQRDGRWCAEVNLGTGPGGKQLRKRVYGPTEAAVKAARRTLVAAHARGDLVPGKSPTLEEWTRYWLTEICPGRLKPATILRYESTLRVWVWDSGPAKVKIDRLNGQHFDKLYNAVREAGRGESSVAAVHRILRRALNVAVQRRKLPRNPMADMDSPTVPHKVQDVFTPDDARRLIDAALTAPGGLRWVFALALGPRQGERLALGRDDINLAANTITINKSLYRLPWKHGCGDDAPACGRRYGSNCPQRRDGGLFVGPPKSAAGNREIPIPAPMVPLIKEQFHLLDRIKIEEGPNWAPFTPANPPRDKVKPYEPFFARRDGRPMDPRTDHAEWKRFLTAAGVRETRLHDARHTAATILLVLGVDPRVVMDILGWSQVSMLSRYQHVLDEVRQAAGQQIGNMLFGPPTPPAPPTPAPEPAGNVIGVDFTARSRRREAR